MAIWWLKAAPALPWGRNGECRGWGPGEVWPQPPALPAEVGQARAGLSPPASSAETGPSDPLLFWLLPCLAQPWLTYHHDTTHLAGSR